MTKNEALRLALEALEALARYENPQTKIQIRKKDGGSIVTMYPHKVASEAITAIKAALEAKDEPVAWMYDWTSDDGEFIQDWTTSMAETLRDTGKTIITNVRPLYLTPQVIHKPLKHLGEIPMAWCRWSEDLGKWMYTHRQPTEELAWIPLYTSPPPVAEPHKRKPLTDEEIRRANHHMVDGAYDYSFKQGVRWAEKVHGIKWEWEA